MDLYYTIVLLGVEHNRSHDTTIHSAVTAMLGRRILSRQRYTMALHT
jgi:hypothetical protein